MSAKLILGTIQMSDGTTRSARKSDEGRVEFFTFGNANARQGHAWRKASPRQAETFEPRP